MGVTSDIYLWQFPSKICFLCIFLLMDQKKKMQAESFPWGEVVRCSFSAKIICSLKIIVIDAFLVQMEIKRSPDPATFIPVE